MTQKQPESAGNPISGYNYRTESTHLENTQSDGPTVLVPPQPPEFGPAAARALLQLLIAIHQSRHNGADPSRSTHEY
jgi:hypothetical protein